MNSSHRTLKSFPFDLLTLLLPNPTQTLFLRVCLLSGDSAREAWRAWRARIGDAREFFVRDTTGMKRLLPLLACNLRANNIPVEFDWLKAAALREELRAATFWRTSARVFTALDEDNIPFIVGKGASVDALAYPQRGLRHSHDLDLIVQDIESAAHTLARAGIKRVNAFQFRDESDLLISLHVQLFELPFYNPPDWNVWERTRTEMIYNVRVRGLTPEDRLAQILGHASYGSGRASAQWVCDAWFVLKRGRIDWNAFIERIRVCRLSLPSAALLNYLMKELGAEIPSEAIEGLNELAIQSDSLACGVALHGVRAGPRGSRRAMWKCARGVQSRLRLMRWMVLPPPQSLIATNRLAGTKELRRFYFDRFRK